MPRSPMAILADLASCTHPDTRNDRVRAHYITASGAHVNAHTCLRCGAVALHEMLSKDDPRNPRWQTPDLVAQLIGATSHLHPSTAPPPAAECPAQLPAGDPNCPYAGGACPVHGSFASEPETRK